MLDFARAGAAVGATSGTLEKTRILGGYFRTLDEDDLKRAAVYMSGRAFPPSQRRTLGLGWSTLSKVVSSVSSKEEDELGGIFRKHSDLGDWAGEALTGSTQPGLVSLKDVEDSLEAIRGARGNAKAAPLEAMVRRMDAESARFFVKIISGEMRIGLSEGLVEAAIAEAFGVSITQVKRVHLVTGDIGETAVRCKRGDFEASSITLFQPVRFMLASPVETPDEAFSRMGADTVWTEEKYDGVRCQLHRQADRPRAPRRHIQGDARSRQRGTDGQRPAEPVHAWPAGPGVAEAQAAAGDAGRGRDRGRVGPRQAARGALRLHVRGQRRCVRPAGQRGQGVQRPHGRRDRRVHEAIPGNDGPGPGPPAHGSARGGARGRVRHHPALGPAPQRLRAALPAHRAYPRRQAGRRDRHPGAGGRAL